MKPPRHLAIIFFLVMILVSLIIPFFKNKGIDSLLDDWPMTVIGASIATSFFLFCIRCITKSEIINLL